MCTKNACFSYGRVCGRECPDYDKPETYYGAFDEPLNLGKLNRTGTETQLVHLLCPTRVFCQHQGRGPMGGGPMMSAPPRPGGFMGGGPMGGGPMMGAPRPGGFMGPGPMGPMMGPRPGGFMGGGPPRGTLPPQGPSPNGNGPGQVPRS